jgi:hypothetical protein
MRTVLISLLVAASAAQPALAGDERGCSLREDAVTLKASFRTGVSLRRKVRAPICLRETRPLTPSCLSATAMLTQ